MNTKLHNKILGKIGEDQASKFLRESGYEIVDRNYRTKFGEIDIIATKSNVLYCVEVKTRSSIAYGYPSEAITLKKLQRMMLTAQIASQKHNYTGEIKLLLVEILSNQLKMTELEP